MAQSMVLMHTGREANPLAFVSFVDKMHRSICMPPLPPSQPATHSSSWIGSTVSGVLSWRRPYSPKDHRHLQACFLALLGFCVRSFSLAGVHGSAEKCRPNYPRDSQTPQVEMTLLRTQQNILRASHTHQGLANGLYLIYSLLAMSEGFFFCWACVFV